MKIQSHHIITNAEKQQRHKVWVLPSQFVPTSWQEMMGYRVFDWYSRLIFLTAKFRSWSPEHPYKHFPGKKTISSKRHAESRGRDLFEEEVHKLASRLKFFKQYREVSRVQVLEWYEMASWLKLSDIKHSSPIPEVAASRHLRLESVIGKTFSFERVIGLSYFRMLCMAIKGGERQITRHSSLVHSPYLSGFHGMNAYIHAAVSVRISRLNTSIILFILSVGDFTEEWEDICMQITLWALQGIYAFISITWPHENHACKHGMADFGKLKDTN